jgi:hypothetical protein
MFRIQLSRRRSYRHGRATRAQPLWFQFIDLYWDRSLLKNLLWGRYRLYISHYVPSNDSLPPLPSHFTSLPFLHFPTSASLNPIWLHCTIHFPTDTLHFTYHFPHFPTSFCTSPLHFKISLLHLDTYGYIIINMNVSTYNAQIISLFPFFCVFDPLDLFTATRTTHQPCGLFAPGMAVILSHKLRKLSQVEWQISLKVTLWTLWKQRKARQQVPVSIIML